MTTNLESWRASGAIKGSAGGEGHGGKRQEPSKRQADGAGIGGQVQKGVRERLSVPVMGTGDQ